MEELIVKYLTGEISSNELKILEDWVAIPDNKKEFENIVKLNVELINSYSEIDVNEKYKLINDKVQSKNEDEKTFGLNVFKRIVQYAALIFIFVCIPYMIYLNFNKKEIKTLPLNEIVLILEDESTFIIHETFESEILNKKGEFIGVMKDSILSLKDYKKISSNDNSKYRELIVPYGKHLKVKMMDETLITLNSGSEIQFPKSFKDKKSREVILKGEAYFEVVKNKNKPFIVYSDSLNIKVLGTKFNVSSYESEKTSVVLEEGSVTVQTNVNDSASDDNIFLKPGDEAILSNGEFKRQIADIEKALAWVERKLYFKNDKFGDVIKKLERYYNIEIINYSEDLNNTRYTGVFEGNTIFDILEIFKETSDFNFKETKDQKIIITPSKL